MPVRHSRHGMVTAPFHSAPRIFYSLLSHSLPLYREKSFPFVQVDRKRGDDRRYPCCISLPGLSPRNIAKRTARVCVSISVGREMALCRSWIDSAVICVTMDYSLFHSLSIWIHFYWLPFDERLRAMEGSLQFNL